ncbi:helix-turn-helix domain-containing protein [Cohnella sp. GCM10020058]|uniref:helix-turn-helix domain-containing protein n=1 Tax=Cohnella sp. GCM10020058 TaxID=3317330 RepID=UPI00362512D4
MKLEELPDVLTAPDIAAHQRVHQSTVYALFERAPAAGGIPNYKIGRSRRAEKAEYIKWLEAQKREAELKYAK